MTALHACPETKHTDDSRVPHIELTIMGNGFFVVRDPGSRECLATQSGRFSLDSHGYLVTGSGARVQGCSDASLSMKGDVQINIKNFPAAPEDSTTPAYSVDEEGKILVHLSGGATCVCGRIMLQNFEDPRALVSEGEQLYSNLNAAGPLAAMAPPGSNGLGAIHSGPLALADAHSSIWPR